jgi:hypothetical protein
MTPAVEAPEGFTAGDMVIVLGPNQGRGQPGVVREVISRRIVEVRISEGPRLGTVYLRPPERLFWVAGPSKLCPRSASNYKGTR